MQKSITQSLDALPGAEQVIRIHGGQGFYCQSCQTEIQPMFIVDGELEIPVCENCFLDEVVDLKQDIGDVKDIIPEEEIVWESYCG